MAREPGLLKQTAAKTNRHKPLRTKNRKTESPNENQATRRWPNSDFISFENQKHLRCADGEKNDLEPEHKANTVTSMALRW